MFGHNFVPDKLQRGGDHQKQSNSNNVPGNTSNWKNDRIIKKERRNYSSNEHIPTAVATKKNYFEKTRSKEICDRLDFVYVY